MASAPEGYYSGLEGWLQNQFKGKYTSLIKINGHPILPPLMTEERRAEMRLLRLKAVEFENKLHLRRASGISDETAGGEGLYEAISDDIHFATSLPSSLNENADCPPHLKEALNTTAVESWKEQDIHPKIAQDMLREFDPLAPEQIGTLSECAATPHYEDEDGKKGICLETSDSKTSSADTSASLSNSTDLNQYMDVTESSIWDAKSGAATATTTPSTLQQQDSSCESRTLSKLDGRTTYEDLNNYLDTILNNSDNIRINRVPKHDILNRVQSPLDRTDQAGQNVGFDLTAEVGTLNKCSNGQSNFSPEPLTEPLDSLQTSYLPDRTDDLTLSKNNANPSEGSLSFLRECSISPVLQDQPVLADPPLKTSKEENNAYFSTSIQHGSQKCQISSSSAKEESFKSQLPRDSHPSIETEAPNIILDAPPRLVRSNSYTLDSPSPLLLAHMEAELRKKSSVKTSNQTKSLTQNRTRSALCSGRSRRVWDIERAKNSSNWYNKQSSLPNNQLKKDSGSRTPRKPQINNSVGHPSPTRVEEFMAMSTSLSIQPSIVRANELKLPTSDSSKANYQSNLNHHGIEESTEVPLASPVDSCNEENLSLILAKLQIQHTKEMEELLSRQNKEKEAVKLVLLKEQIPLSSNLPARLTQNVLPKLSGNAAAASPTILQRLNFSESPPSKDKAVLMERRNTCPSVCDKNLVESQKCVVQLRKNSSLLLTDVSCENGATSRMDPDYEASSCNKVISFSSTQSQLESSTQQPSNLSQNNDDEAMLSNRLPTFSSAEGFASYGLHLNGTTSVNFSAKMTSSFPTSHLSDGLQSESMVTSLPSSFDFFGDLPFDFSGQSQFASSNLSASVPSNMMPSTVQLSHTSANSVQDTSSQNRRKSWCSRQLFSEKFGNNSCQGPDWVIESQELQKHSAAARIQAGVRGYLTRRLLRTERVQNCITTIRDTIVCALQLQKECAPHVEASDLQLHGRLIQQLSAACEDLHNIFLGLSVSKRMAIISADRMRLLTRSSRSSSGAGSRPLSRATQIALQRKSNQSETIETSSVHSTASSSYRARRRSWATTDARAGPSPSTATASAPTSAPNVCEVVTGCLSRSSAPSGHILQRSASAGSSRRPWR